MNDYWGPFKQSPNLLILLTDQQRTAQHLPAGWVQQNLPNLWALMQGGVNFPNAMTNTTACSPARATLWTSTFPMINGVNSVGQTLVMTDVLTTLGLALARYAPAGVTYNIAYKGKWHLDGSFESGQTLAAAGPSSGPPHCVFGSANPTGDSLRRRLQLRIQTLWSWFCC